MLKSAASPIGKFAKNTDGNFAMLLALSLPALVLTTGLCVDGARMYSAQTKLTAAMDAAVLATARDITKGVLDEDQARTAIENFMEVNLASASLANIPFVIDDLPIDKTAKTVGVSAHLDLPTYFMKVFGSDSVRVPAFTKAAYSNTKIEVSMALDVTGSMSGQKLAALKKAAKAGIDELIPDAAAASRVRIGLVPYAATVNAYPVINRIDTDGATNGCVYERTGTDAATDAFSDSYAPVKGTTYNCVSAEIEPLTSDVSDLKQSINSFSADGVTAGHIAIAWSQYMLSPNWNAAWPTSAQAASYTDAQTRKYAIIMTDGIFNTFNQAIEISANTVSPSSRDYALNMCAAMKSKGIKVYTIAFEAPTDASALMDDCANDDTSDQTFFYDAADEDELKEAFVAIAKDIEMLRLTQ